MNKPTKEQILAHLDEVKAYIKEAESKKSLMPKEGERYGYITDNGHTYMTVWTADSVDIDRFNQGNVFPTKEAAEAERDRRAALQRIKVYIHEHDLGLEPVWRGWWQVKWCVYYDHGNNELKSVCHTVNQDFLPFGYLKSNTATTQLIKDMEKDLKIVFGA